MTETAFSRRTILRNTVHLVVLGSTSVWLHGCKKEELHCDDTGSLSEEDAKLRSSLEYRDRSPHGEAKRCATCAFYVARGEHECGRCTLIKGPIHPLGYCNSWSAKG